MLAVDRSVPGAHRRLVGVVDRLLVEQLVPPLVPLLVGSDRRQVHDDLVQPLVFGTGTAEHQRSVVSCHDQIERQLLSTTSAPLRGVATGDSLAYIGI